MELTGVGVVIVGAGAIGSATARLLQRAGVGRLLVARRGRKAQVLAQALGAELVDLEQLPEIATWFSLIVSSTSSGEERVLSEELKGWPTTQLAQQIKPASSH